MQLVEDKDQLQKFGLKRVLVKFMLTEKIMIHILKIV